MNDQARDHPNDQADDSGAQIDNEGGPGCPLNAEGTAYSLQEQVPGDNEVDELAEDEVDEFLGALEFARAGASPMALKIMRDLSVYFAALPDWRKSQLAKAGYHGAADQPAKLVLLITFIEALASIKSDGRVNLSQEETAEACHISKTRAGAFLHLLESACVLRCVRRGNWSRRLSTTYEFAAKDAGDSEVPF